MLRIEFPEARTPAQRPAIFIDRDGVINCRRAGGYVLNWAQFEFVEGIRAALKQIASLGLPMIVISNQAAVGKGLLDEKGLRDITSRMRQELLAGGAPIAAAYYCTHRTDEHCACRKPKPELLFRAAQDFDIDLGRSVFIGDSETDIRAAQAAGCAPVLFGSGLTNHSDSEEWMKGVPAAARPEQLFEVVSKRLHGLEAGARSRAV